MDTTRTILVVDEQASEREVIARSLERDDYKVVAAEGIEQAMRCIDQPLGVVVSGLRMNQLGGLDVLRTCRERRPPIPLLIVVGQGETDAGVEAMKIGADHYLVRPVNQDELLMLVRRCVDVRRKDAAIEQLQHRLDRRFGFDQIIGHSKPMQDVIEVARRAALTESPALIIGESGTGRELIAESIHQNSSRRKGPFITVNMAAVPEHLLASELFGHVNGVLAGASETRLGRFEAARGGSIFIDEIADVTLEVQARLMHVFEHHTVMPLGGDREYDVNTRVIAATSHNLETMVEKQEFRVDLYSCLLVTCLQVPPLRQRPEDIPLLVSHLMRELCQAAGRELLTLDPALRQHLETYDWPGNVRQLRNCLESMILLTSAHRLTLDDVPATVDSGRGASGNLEIPEGTTLEELEREAVEQVLEKHGQNRTHAARSLGISVRTLQRKLKAWEMEEHSQSRRVQAS